jgi:hypothetical protein
MAELFNHSRRAIVGRGLAAIALTTGCLGAAPALSAAADESEPLQCWWRTSVSAVTVGAPFTLVLTCAALQTESTTAVVDRGRLDPRAIELTPFEVIGGSVAPDVRAGDRVFFQNQYTLRFVNDAFFDQDVALPALAVSYRLQTRGAEREASTQGMERRFALPHQMVRITSLVPGDATDIRDAGGTTFADVDALASRGRLLTTTGMIVMGLAAVVTLVGVGRAVAPRMTAPAAEEGLVRDALILRRANQQLVAVRREREAGGWTIVGVAHALATARIVAEYAIGRAANQRRADARRPAPAGSMVIARRWHPGEVVLVSGAVTPKTLALELTRRAQDQEHAPARLEQLRQALTVFTVAEYSDGGLLDERALDESLSTIEGIARRLALERTWLLQRFKPSRWRRSAQGIAR